jgi:hypothetical protein
LKRLRKDKRAFIKLSEEDDSRKGVGSEGGGAFFVRRVHKGVLFSN